MKDKKAIMIACLFIIFAVFLFHRLSTEKDQLEAFLLKENLLIAEITELQSRIEETERNYIELDNIYSDENYKHRAYSAVFKEYQKYLYNVLLEEGTNSKNDLMVNGLFIGEGFPKAIAKFGNPIEEKPAIDDAHGTYTYIYLLYEDGTRVTLDPIFVSGIKFENPQYSTNLGVAIGDLAPEAMDKCKGLYETVISTHTNEELLGWYEISDDFFLILYFTNDDIRYQNHLVIEENMRVRKIEIVERKIFD